MLNLTTLKTAAELAKANPTELELWQMEISPEDVLRLAEVARAAKAHLARRTMKPSVTPGELALMRALEGVEL